MKILLRCWWLILLIAGCSSPPMLGESSNPLATPVAFAQEENVLCLDTSRLPLRTLPSEPHVIRSRLVEINLDALLDETGQARAVEEITLNLFPDATYIGVIENIAEEGDGYAWSGHLKGIEFSALYMVYTSGIFLAHFDSPLGVYEIDFVEDDLYRVIQIEQLRYPGGEG